jgi:hypothetical protein
MRLLTAPLLAAAILSAGCGQDAARREAAIMDRIERSVRLEQAFMAKGNPPGPGASYARYYAWSAAGRKVEAVYTSSKPAGRHWVEENALPIVLDGGCGYIRMTFDVRADRIEKLACNGIA